MRTTITLALANIKPHMVVFLMNYGYRCFTAATHQGVLALIAERPIDCLIAEVSFAIEPINGLPFIATLLVNFPTLFLSDGSALVHRHLKDIYGKPHQEFAIFPVDIEEIGIKIVRIIPKQ